MNDSSYNKLTGQLENTASISFKDICDILDAFQIASGQGFAISKTKAMLDYLKNGNSILIKNFGYSGESKEISSIKELLNVYQDIDQSVDLTIDREFKEYLC